MVERHGGGQPKPYTPAEQERILREVRRKPVRDQDGTATWSLTTLQRVLRRPDGLPRVSTCTIWCVLNEAGFTRTKEQNWCETGTVTVIDPSATAKNLIEAAYQQAVLPICYDQAK